MRVRLVRRPGQHGTKAYVTQYGERLICVRYRYDEATQKRYKTIEIIVDEQPWVPKKAKPSMRKLAADTLVGVRLDRTDRTNYHHLWRMGALWDPKLGVWHLRYDEAIALGLTDRIIGTIEALSAGR